MSDSYNYANLRSKLQSIVYDLDSLNQKGVNINSVINCSISINNKNPIKDDLNSIKSNVNSIKNYISNNIINSMKNK